MLWLSENWQEIAVTVLAMGALGLLAVVCAKNGFWPNNHVYGGFISGAMGACANFIAKKILNK